MGEAVGTGVTEEFVEMNLKIIVIFEIL